MTYSLPEVLDIFEQMGAPIERAARRLPLLLFGRK